MSWKKKEKPLTPEEAIVEAKRELAPFWFGSEPLLAATQTETGASVFPLNSTFTQTPWLFSFIDPTEFSGERAIRVIREWHRRYSSHKLGFVLIFRAPEPFVRSAPDLLRKFQVQFPAMYDRDDLLAQSFGIQSWPGVIVRSWSSGTGGVQEVVRGSGAAWIEEIEEKVQILLRKGDPGLSLPLPFSLPHAVVSQSRVDFGTVKGKPVSALSQVIELQGNWRESENCLTTSDPSATAVISVPSPVFSLIAQASIESPTKILVEPVEGSLMQEWIPEGISTDEGGRAISRVQLFGIYDLLTDLPANRRRVKLSFPDADTVPIQIYGLRFGGR